MIQDVLCFLERSAGTYPDKPAFSNEHTSLTYRELLELPRWISTYLDQRLDPRRPIPMMAEKSVFALGVLMGAVTAGCLYVCLDPNQLAKRLSQILDSLQAQWMIADSESLNAVGDTTFSGEIIDLEALEALPPSSTDSGLLASIRSQSLDTDLLYGIFASGSTSTPEGMMVGHRSATDFIGYFTDMFHITSQDVVGNQALFDFDVSVKDIYSALKTGTTTEIIPKRLFPTPTGLLDYLCQKQITTAIWVVSALCITTTLNGFTYRVPTYLDKILLSGEAMPVKHLNAWRKYPPHAMLIDLYGPTEITCNCTYCVIDRDFEPESMILMGTASPNKKVFLLNEEGYLMTIPRRQGEVCVAGTALALGCYRGPQRTGASFVQNPLNQSYPEIIYRMGDMAHYGSDGPLYFQARKNFQTEHMGHRIELGEIEAVLMIVGGVTRAVCTFLEGKNKIAAFYEENAHERQITARLEPLLPRYMFPNTYENLDQPLLTKDGKIGRKALREPYV